MKAKSITELKPTFNSKFFLDTNIWLYLYFPQYTSVSKNIITNYSNFFDEILSKECMIVTDMIQMSELINLVLRIEFNTLKNDSPSLTFKEYRDTTSYLNALSIAKTLSSNILKCATLRSGIFNAEELKVMVENCDQADFNDIYFANFCSKENAILITHDFDFNAIKTNIALFTINGKYLN
jgi:hypothetical protein